MLEIIEGDAITRLRGMPPESVHCCVTSPPYWGLRDYGTASWEGGDATCSHEPPQSWIDHNFNANSAFGTGAATQSAAAKGRWYGKDGSCKCGAKRIDAQLGLERTPEEYVARMVEIFREVRRVVRKDGTLWLNLGDSYAGSWGNYGGQNRGSGSQREITSGSKAHQKSYDGLEDWRPPNSSIDGLKPKDLCGIPWRVAFALQADGWWLRSDIIWAKPNPMPESCTDRPTKAHEYLFLLTKSASYFYDAEAIKEKTSELTDWTYAQPDKAARAGQSTNGTGATSLREFQSSRNKRSVWTVEDEHALAQWLSVEVPEAWERFKQEARNKRDVWKVATAPYPEAHFATYPPDLIKPCILAGSRVGDTILDPFAGSGTTGMVALELGRKAILIELNLKYIALIHERCNITPGLQLA